MIGTVMDAYALLGVKPDATVDEIRRAYRKLALRLHPDRNPQDKDAEKKFKEVSQAYDVLSDVERRKKYEADRTAPKPPPPPPPNYPVANVAVEVELNAYDLKNGCDKTVTVSRPRTCPDCRGTGFLTRPQIVCCVLCGGSGCQTCSWQGRVTSSYCSRCWNSGTDRETTLITVRIPPGIAPYGRTRLIGNGNLWGLRGPFYIDANVRFRVEKPGLIIR
jgi:molecular chaperone DnaJ